MEPPWKAYNVLRKMDYPYEASTNSCPVPSEFCCLISIITSESILPSKITLPWSNFPPSLPLLSLKDQDFFLMFLKEIGPFPFCNPPQPNKGSNDEHNMNLSILGIEFLYPHFP